MKRDQGYGFGVGQAVPHEISVAAPVLDSRGYAVAAVQVPVYLPQWSAEEARAKIAPLVGAQAHEVIACDSVSVNLAKLIGAALSLNPGRKVVLSEPGNFPTDLYMIQGDGRVEQRLAERDKMIDALRPEKRFENVAQLQALPRQKRVLAPFVALDVASLYETQFFHFDERGVGGGFGEMRPVAQFALRQPVFLPEDAQENPLTERNIFRLQSKLKRPVEPAGRQSYQPGHALVGLDRYVA